METHFLPPPFPHSVFHSHPWEWLHYRSIVATRVAQRWPKFVFNVFQCFFIFLPNTSSECGSVLCVRVWVPCVVAYGFSTWVAREESKFFFLLLYGEMSVLFFFFTANTVTLAEKNWGSLKRKQVVSGESTKCQWLKMSGFMSVYMPTRLPRNCTHDSHEQPCHRVWICVSLGCHIYCARTYQHLV